MAVTLAETAASAPEEKKGAALDPRLLRVIEPLSLARIVKSA